jgi:hypothetical protein
MDSPSPYSDFSFGKLLRHLDGKERNPSNGPPVPQRKPTCVPEGYVANLGASKSAEFKALGERYFATPRRGEDPVGTKPITLGASGMEKDMAQLFDVPFVPIKGEMTAPPTFSLGNKAAMSFRLWAEVDGRKLTIDIIESSRP